MMTEGYPGLQKNKRLRRELDEARRYLRDE
jgi:hypothetical protein